MVRDLPAGSDDHPTPSDMTVRELITHVVIGNRFTALLLAGVDRNHARNQLAGDPLAGGVLSAVAESARQQMAAFEAAEPGRLVAGPTGQLPVAAYLRFRVVDLVVHGWDLLRAAALDETLDPEVTAGVVLLVQPHLEEMLAFGAYGAGPSGVLPPDASPQSRLLDWFGRRP